MQFPLHSSLDSELMKTQTCFVYGEHDERWDSRGEMHAILHLHTHMHIIIHCASFKTQENR